jgi:GNAT superfamily N-acetyltransferase
VSTPTEEMKLRKIVTPTHVSFAYIDKGVRPVATLEADAIFGGEIHEVLQVPQDTKLWWIARCLVREEFRKKQIGSELLTKLKEQVGNDWIVVVPGGYGADPVLQKRFYTNNGFEANDKEPGLLVWRNKQEVQK